MIAGILHAVLLLFYLTVVFNRPTVSDSIMIDTILTCIQYTAFFYNALFQPIWQRQGKSASKSNPSLSLSAKVATPTKRGPFKTVLSQVEHYLVQFYIKSCAATDRGPRRPLSRKGPGIREIVSHLYWTEPSALYGRDFLVATRIRTAQWILLEDLFMFCICFNQDINLIEGIFLIYTYRMFGKTWTDKKR